MIDLLNNKYIFDGGFGLERETLRITSEGKLAQTLHPFKDSHLERDFCENQLEIITPVCSSVDEVVKELGRLSDHAQQHLAEYGEYLWLNSNPPHIESEDDIPIARYSGEKKHKREYRVNLERRYGKRLMLYSGIHFNFSFSDKFLKSICTDDDFKAFKDDLYLKLLKYVSCYSWLIVLLTAASPLYDASFDADGQSGTAFDGLSSRRNSEKGYWNTFIPKLDYSSLSDYAKSVEYYINKGVLFSAGELYLPVRLKSRGENSIEALVKNGVDHIELRMFDLNPLAKYGVFAEDLKFAHYFLIYLISLPDFDFNADMQAQAIENHKEAAKFDLDEIQFGKRHAKDAALKLLDDMSAYFESASDVLEIIEFQRRKLSGKNRYSDKVYNEYINDFNNISIDEFTKKRGKKICASCSEQT